VRSRNSFTKDADMGFSPSKSIRLQMDMNQK